MMREKDEFIQSNVVGGEGKGEEGESAVYLKTITN